MVRFHEPYGLERADRYIQDVLKSGNVQGDGKYNGLCSRRIGEMLHVERVHMMTSCTHALECVMRVIGLQEDDEVIVPSFTFPSTANAVVLAGGQVVFCEVEKKSLTIDVRCLEKLITERTKAVVVVHYGGVSCDMDEVMKIADRYGLVVVEDAAQSFLTAYDGRYTGTIGDFGCLSFHGTKDIVAGEGGALIVNNEKYAEAVDIFRQKGTNRSSFISGRSSFYQWVDEGSSYSPGELSMALLYSQLEMAQEILDKRKYLYGAYAAGIREVIERLGLENRIACSSMPSDEVNGHLFFLVFDHTDVAVAFRKHMKDAGVETRTHFVPLHESRMGRQFVNGDEEFSVERELGKRLVRLPLYPDLDADTQKRIIIAVEDYLKQLV